MRAIVLFEDDDRGYVTPIIKNLEQATEAIPDITIEKETYNYHIAVKENINKWGANQVWLVDLKSEKMDGPDFDEVGQEEWCKQLLDSDNDEFLSMVRRLRRKSDLASDFEHFAGLAVAVEAARNNIPFIYVSQYDQLAGDVLRYLQWGEDYKNHSLRERSISKIDLKDDMQDALQRVLDFAFSSFSDFHITGLGCHDWRIIRTSDEPVELRLRKCPDEDVQNALRDRKGDYRPNPFYPHHLKGGKHTHESGKLYGVDISKWAAFIVSDDAMQILRRYGYNFQTGIDFQGPVTIWQRPPIRALIQDNNHSNDFDQILKLWADELPNTTEINDMITEIQNRNGSEYCGSNMKHLWFNLPGVLHVLSTLGGLSGEEGGWLLGQHISVTFILIGGTKTPINRNFTPYPDEEMFNGFLCGVFVDGAGFSHEFPADEKDSHRLCNALLKLGAKWVLYCDRDKDMKDTLYTTLCALAPEDLEDQICSYSAAISDELWSLESAPPLLSFFVPAVPHFSPFNTEDVVPLVAKVTPIDLSDQNAVERLLHDAIRYVAMLADT